MPLDKAKSIIADIRKGNIAPIYFLMGDEPYYIDGISKFIEESILSEEERGFNQMVLYGRDVSIDDIVGNAKRYPMMAERQVVIVKEAQDLSRTIENLVPYAENPQPTTVLVLCYKYKKLDARKKLAKTLKKSGVIFESKKLYDNQVPEWIQRVLSAKGYTITPKAAQMLTEFLGNDLSKISNELEKLQLVIKPEQQISPQLIEENIGISKDFNNFELQNAIGNRNVKKAFAIVQYFGQNPKNHPLVMTVALLYSFFSKLLKYHALSNKSEAPKVLGVSPYFIKDYQTAAKNYSMKEVSGIIASIRTIDLKGKGVGAANMSQADLLKELLTSIFK
ncbi:MAG TPA: DNA polymerase III subunit delta [Flavobacteriaceae bacterium]|jgi:DNA polymerase-3 subunit delta|nr:DNA polymerase III subunit delta [Flavobacteriaceae bacterium]MAY53405.1 DNA polymerase III subunit delta [Flavobacteriaceae bacterium]HBR52717.1 DNA polymerase III subunit delta [Flavobacteriaceae bacterium]HIB48225.1 DNA polymerase III subunit delta [Flavobacteriaceae bacterium]HIN97670.1 DNA polymerase III subunit delta [Flavobacteriaceae bacterium]|tara:strand:+ start:232 stop:1236 length:1005 start_codon:yes stop_codon:yes gene_type:complete